MMILGIHGSPRRDGNSDILLRAVLDAAAAAGATTRELFACDLDIHGCLECGGCDETGECVIEDDMGQVYPLLEAADAIVMATPIFFYGPPAQLKALIDRAQAQWNKRRLSRLAGRPEGRKRAGWLVAVGATRGKNLFDGTSLVARYFFDALDMTCEEGLLLRQVEGKGDVLKRPDDLEAARALGRRIAAATQG